MWGGNWTAQNCNDLDEIEVLRDYLQSIKPSSCGIRLFVPASHTETTAVLRKLNVRFITTEIFTATAETSKQIAENELAAAVQTALACDADALVTTNSAWFPYIDEIDNLGSFLTDTGFLRRPCELFVRGHDIPWAFGSPTVGLTWNGFYHFAEQDTLKIGLDFLYTAQKKKASADAQEAGRSLVHNRIPNICFTRDRLLFYGIQKMAAFRANWKRQQYNFEISYYLNFYYPLLYGGFDHIALLVNHCLKLGLPEKNVGARYEGFLDALQAKSPTLHGIFTDTEHVDFMKRIGALRHYASHRGSLAPGKLIEKPEREPTNEELDAEIAEAGADIILHFMPKGELRDSVQEMLRYNFKMAHYEKGKVVDGVVLIEIDGKWGFINPANDTEWNFQKFLLFMNQVLTELVTCL